MCTSAVQTQQPVRGEALRGAVKGQKGLWFFFSTERPTWLPEALWVPRASLSRLQPPSASQTSGTLPTPGILKSGPGNRGRSACGPTHVVFVEIYVCFFSFNYFPLFILAVLGLHCCVDFSLVVVSRV